MANLNQHQHGNMNGQGAAANILNGQAQGNLFFEVGPQQHHVAHHRPRFVGENGVYRPRYTSVQKETALRLLNQGVSYRQVAQVTSQNCSRETTRRWHREAAEARLRNLRRRIVNCGHFLLSLLKLAGMLVLGWLVCFTYLHDGPLICILLIFDIVGIYNIIQHILAGQF